MSKRLFTEELNETTLYKFPRLEEEQILPEFLFPTEEMNKLPSGDLPQMYVQEPFHYREIFELDVVQFADRIKQTELLLDPKEWNFPFLFQSRELFPANDSPVRACPKKFEIFRTNITTIFFSKGPKNPAVNSFIENTAKHGLEIIATWKEVKTHKLEDFYWYVLAMTTQFGMDGLDILHFIDKLEDLHEELNQHPIMFAHIVLFLEHSKTLDLKFPFDVAPTMPQFGRQANLFYEAYAKRCNQILTELPREDRILRKDDVAAHDIIFRQLIHQEKFTRNVLLYIFKMPNLLCNIVHSRINDDTFLVYTLESVLSELKKEDAFSHMEPILACVNRWVSGNTQKTIFKRKANYLVQLFMTFVETPSDAELLFLYFAVYLRPDANRTDIVDGKLHPIRVRFTSLDLSWTSLFSFDDVCKMMDKHVDAVIHFLRFFWPILKDHDDQVWRSRLKTPETDADIFFFLQRALIFTFNMQVASAVVDSINVLQYVEDRFLNAQPDQKFIQRIATIINTANVNWQRFGLFCPTAKENQIFFRTNITDTDILDRYNLFCAKIRYIISSFGGVSSEFNAALFQHLDRQVIDIVITQC